MRALLIRIARVIAYTGAGVVILLAVAVSLFRLFLPRLPAYQDDIKDWASEAVGMRVEFSGMDARWGLSGPEVEFYDTELWTADAVTQIANAGEVGVSIGLIQLLIDRKLVVDRVVVRDTTVDLRQLDDGTWKVQGRALDEFLTFRNRQTGGDTDIELIGQGISLHLWLQGDDEPSIFEVQTVSAHRDPRRLAVDAIIDPPAALGRGISVSASRSRAEAAPPDRWDVDVEVEGAELAGLSNFPVPEAFHFRGGQGDIVLSVAFESGRIDSAAATVDLREIRVAEEAAFSVDGTFEYERNSSGWLLASGGYSLLTANGAWPESTIRIEVGTNGDGRPAMIDLRASYLRLEDVLLVMPWLTARQQDLVEPYAIEGEIGGLALTLGGVDSDLPRFDVSADLKGVGFAAVDDQPGIRDFTGNLRADRSGGRLEINAPGMAVTYPRFLGQTAYLSEASGTLIWRRSDGRTTLLSDSIVLRNEDFDFESNVQITLADDSRAPIVDLAATWSIEDLAKAKRYIPFIPRIPKTSAWFQEGILSGRVPRGTTRLYGPMDKFPFDGGEGRFYVEADVQDANIRYLPRWPVARIVDCTLAIENMRLFSERNRVITVGNEVTNAKFELGDFRLPIITIEAESGGSLDALRELLAQSPLGTDVFGGKLEQIRATGDGTFSLDLEVPVRNTDAKTFSARLETENGSLRLTGFPAPLTDLSGIVTVRDEDVDSESLTGTFLGRPVTIDLEAISDESPPYRISANARGSATAVSILEELGLPLEGRISGETPYSALLLFPRGKAAEKAPFAIEIDTELDGLAISLPRPLGKVADAKWPLSAMIEFPADDERITSRGSVEGFMSWAIDFARTEGYWDLDRGVVQFGAAETAAAVEWPETRGLHLRGRTDFIHFENWLDLAKEPDPRTGVADRIRSIDMTIGSLHIIGQHLVEHHYRVDRGAFEWLMQVDGEEVAGSIVVPYDFRSGRELTLDMQRLILPGDEELTDTDREQADPRSLPPIAVRAGEFAIGGRYLGELEAMFRHTADGLEAQNITASDPTFDVTGAGGWVIDESDPRGSRSYVTATLNSRNVERTMQRLNYDPGIVADDLVMSLDFAWSGGPRADFLETLNGEVEVNIGTGQLDEVEPGAGRMFGLMSVVALPRRLSLDFRDVFGKGFGFDKISGTFRVEDGETYTCDLSLEGPAANIAIVGRTGLVSEDYDQAAVVSANFGNTLPVVGGVLGGPQVAAVMLIFSQVFKKPLQEATEIYYTIDGAWDAPNIERATAETFAASVKSTDCVEQPEFVR